MNKFYDQILYDTMMSYLHKPYIWGGNSPLVGVDCSGLVIDILKSVGKLSSTYDASSQTLYNKFKDSETQSGLGFGALCFYGKAPDKIHHVAIMLDDFRILEAGGGNSKNKTLDDAIIKDARVRIRPYNYRRDFIDSIIISYNVKAQ